jgi:N,N-dimethylformamidase
MSGVDVGDLVTLPWRASRNAPRQVRLLAGDWPTGVYAVRLTAKDGRTGFAPFVLRPKTLGTSKHAVVVPTNTWQAYNFYDADGDGFGDTWYAGGNPPVVLTRPYRDRGVPPRFHRYDAPFLRWLSVTDKSPEFITDDDLETIESGDELRRLYDFIAFPGHTEYETAHVYNIVRRFRDLGGRMIFLSANAFFWKVDRTPNQLHRVTLWRSLGRPEAGLLGAQYRANDNGTHQGPYQVVGAQSVPWLFEGTGLENGSLIGDTVGGYGIEVDARTSASPPGTVLVAVIPDIFGPGVNAEMTYYETDAGARVFNAGTLDFAGSVLTYPVSRLLENLWDHMTSR